MTTEQRETLAAEAIHRLNQTTTREVRRQLVNELPRPVLADVRGHFASYGDCFPVGAAVVELIDKRVGKVQ